MQIATQRPRVIAVLGPTNTGKTYLAFERMLAHGSGIMGFPLRLLAREPHASTLVVAATFDRKVITNHPRAAKGLDLFMSKAASPANIALAMTALITGPAARRGKVVVLPSALRCREPAELAFLRS